jgi:hypothetical protein
VTQNAQAVGASTGHNKKEALSVEQRPLWGLARTIAAEHPSLRMTCIDLDESNETDQISSLLQELEGEDKENQIAVRLGKRYVARLTRKKMQMLETPGGVTTRIRGDGSYLITGGLGGLGLQTSGPAIGGQGSEAFGTSRTAGSHIQRNSRFYSSVGTSRSQSVCGASRCLCRIGCGEAADYYPLHMKLISNVTGDLIDNVERTGDGT